MKQIDVEELKKIQLKILNCFDSFCKENGLHYWLDYGTLLGAVRHHGYIPWDDDLDIGMLREDYEIASRLFNKNGNSEIMFMTPQNNGEYRYPFGKLVSTSTLLYEYGEDGIKTGVYVDVFPYDNCPEDDEIKNKMFKKRDFLGRLRRLKLPIRKEVKGIKKVTYIVGSRIIKIFPHNWIEKEIDKNARQYEKDQSDFVCSFVDPYDLKRLKIPKKLFMNFTEVQFEDAKYPAPADYHYWLSSYYGDYMKLPPANERVRHHVFEAFYIEKDDVKQDGE